MAVVSSKTSSRSLAVDVRLSQLAQQQLAELPMVVLPRIEAVLAGLAVVPHSGREFGADSRHAGKRYRVIRIRRGWSYRVAYEITPSFVWIHRIEPSWAF